MGKDPAEVIPAVQIKERMERLVGNYETYKGIEKVRVVNKGGMLHLERRNPISDVVASTPLVPQDLLAGSTVFHEIRGGLKYPVEFRVEADGDVDLFYGRYCYHKKS